MKAVPWLERHGMQLLVACVVAIVLLIGGAVWWSAAAAGDAEAWEKLSSSSTVDEFGAVADKHPGTLAAAWAHLRMGELDLESGINAMFTDRELALKDLKAARENFDLTLKASNLPENLRQRAALGIARVAESTSDGDTTTAITAYEAFLKNYPNSIYQASIEARIAELKTGGASEFYRWFHAQAPKQSAFPRPQDGLPGAGATLPGGNPFELPPAAAPAKPAESTDSPATPEAATPEAATPASTTPAPATTPEAAATPQTPAAPATPAPAAGEAATPAPAATPE